MIWASILCLVLLVGLSAMFAGSELAFYSINEVRIESEAEAGKGSARWIKRLMGDRSGLLITILIGNNLALELVTLLTEYELTRLNVVPEVWRDLAVTIVLTPVLFLFAELVPKDLFHRKPHALLSKTVRPVGLAYLLFWPLMVVLRAFGRMVQRLAGVGDDELVQARGREVVLEVLEESTRGGVLEERTESMAKNALTLSAIPISEVMTPWHAVEKLDANDPELTRAVAGSDHSRLPISRDGVVKGYLHQLEMLGAGPQADPAKHLHRMSALPPETSVQTALGRLRVQGKRAALVGTHEAPLGLVSLKDLAERISGDLAGW